MDLNLIYLVLLQIFCFILQTRCNETLLSKGPHHVQFFHLVLQIMAESLPASHWQSFVEAEKERLLLRNFTGDFVATNEGPFSRAGRKLDQWWHYVKATVVTACETGRSDPRKVIFGAKVGFALSLVSLLIFLELPMSFGKHGIWSIVTVIVVFEFSIGATLSKGFNRAVGTLSAGAIAIGIVGLSSLAGKLQEFVIITGIFVTGFLASYLKLHQSMKQYEYGFRVFLMTFSIVVDPEGSDFIQTAVSRLALIAVGAVISLLVNVCIFPIWSGEDLHKLVVENLRGVASSLEGCINMYLDCVEYSRIPSRILLYQAFDDPLYKGYRAAVQSSSQEDSLVNFAVWEPPHGRYKMLHYPWSEYVKVSGALRHCAFMVMAMHGCILSEIQAPPELRQTFKNGIQRVGTEGCKVLRQLSEKLENLEKLSPGDLLQHVHDSAEDLQMMIDKKSYVLVNAENWECGKRPGKFADLEVLQEMKDGEKRPFITNSFIASAVTSRSTLSLQNSASFSVSRMGSVEDMLSQQTNWPSRMSLGGDTILNEREVRTYESAAALSLATFTSLLIEFVARLQNLVDSYEELSEKAKFKEYANSNETKKVSKFRGMLLSCFCCRKG